MGKYPQHLYVQQYRGRHAYSHHEQLVDEWLRMRAVHDKAVKYHDVISKIQNGTVMTRAAGVLLLTLLVFCDLPSRRSLALSPRWRESLLPPDATLGLRDIRPISEYTLITVLSILLTIRKYMCLKICFFTNAAVGLSPLTQFYCCSFVGPADSEAKRGRGQSTYTTFPNTKLERYAKRGLEGAKLSLRSSTHSSSSNTTRYSTAIPVVDFSVLG